MIQAPLAVAFAAGLVATVNPCGFAMLPAYLSYFMGIDTGQQTRPEAVGRALTVGGVMSLGFLLVFGVAGIVFSAGFRALTTLLPWLALAVGVGIVILGIAMLRGYEMRVAGPKMSRGKGTGDLRSMFMFGVSYAIASLSCTLPAFLAVVASQLTTANLIGGIATFLAFGVGMSALLVALTIALALGKQTLVTRVRRMSQYVNKAAGTILVLAGGYIIWFWSTNINDPVAASRSSAFRFTDGLASDIQTLVGGNLAVVGMILSGLIVTAVVYVVTRARSARS